MLWENSPFTLLPQRSAEKMNRKNWYFIKKNKKKLFPCLRSCWFIYVMESLLSLRLCSPGLKQNKTKQKNIPISSDKLCLSSAPLLCCGSLSSKNTLAQSLLSVDRPTAEDGRKQRRPITWIARQKPKKSAQDGRVDCRFVFMPHVSAEVFLIFNWAALELLVLTCDKCATLSPCCVWSSLLSGYFPWRLLLLQSPDLCLFSVA